MGAWGTEEHENDDFLDYINDENDPETLVKYIKKAKSPDKIVGIFNLLNSSSRNQISKNIIKKGVHYLEDELNMEQSTSDSEWSNQTKRINSIKSQLIRLKRYL